MSFASWPPLLSDGMDKAIGHIIGNIFHHCFLFSIVIFQAPHMTFHFDIINQFQSFLGEIMSHISPLQEKNTCLSEKNMVIYHAELMLHSAIISFSNS